MVTASRLREGENGANNRTLMALQYFHILNSNNTLPFQTIDSGLLPEGVQNCPIWLLELQALRFLMHEGRPLIVRISPNI